MEQRGGVEAIQALEQRSDEELEAETKYKAAALAILGARASERFDADAARSYFQRAIAAARPQERMQIRRMADASLALAERRAGDLKSAVERLGQAPPSGRQLFALRAMGLLVPPASAGILARIRGILLDHRADRSCCSRSALGIVELIALPFGGHRARAGDPARAVRRDRRDCDPRRHRATATKPRQGRRRLRLTAAATPPGSPAARRPIRSCARVSSRSPDRQPIRRRRQGGARRPARPSRRCDGSGSPSSAATPATSTTPASSPARPPEAGETVAALSGDGMVGAIADTLQGPPRRGAGRSSRAGAATTSRGCSESPTSPTRPAAVIAAGHARAIDLGLVADGVGRAAGRSSGSPRWASTATPTGSPTRRPRGSAASCTRTEPCGP